MAEPRPPLWRDAWAWVSALAILPLVLRSRGASWGEPVADDFDHLHHVLFANHVSWLDGGGSRSFWRPLAYQGYYGLLHGVILAHPEFIATLHIGLCLLCVLLLYDIARRHLPGPAAAVVASFPMLLESARALVIVPVHVVDLGLITFSVLAWWLAERGRLWPALAALLAALLCKETAIATALVLPWLARIPPHASRRRWIVASGVLTALWAATYLLVRRGLALELPHGLEAHLTPRLFLEPARYGWALAGTFRALSSLPFRAASHEWAVFSVALLVLGAAGVRFAISDAARARLAAHRGLAVTGLAWFVLASGTLLSVYPVWSPERVVYASLGLGIALTLALWAAHPALPWALLALRLVTFALAPGAPARAVRDLPENGAFVDFERLAWLQRLTTETRSLLRSHFPRLPDGAVVGQLHRPLRAAYAFAGDRSLQVWYRDTTLRWLDWERADWRSDSRPVTIVEFLGPPDHPFALVEPEAMRHYTAAEPFKEREAWPAALAELDSADVAQDDRDAWGFRGMVAGRRALCELGMNDLPATERTARRGLALMPENGDARYALVEALAISGRLAEARAHADTLLALYPNDAAVRDLAARLGR
jgi:hypothetical protein